MRATSAAAALVVVAVALGLRGAVATNPAEGYDGAAHVAYAQILREDGRLPTEAESYEYASPPAYAWLAVQAERIVDATGDWIADWRAGQAISILWLAAFLVVSWLLAREVWPGNPRLVVMATLASAAIPVVLRMGAMFHPEMQFALFGLVAILLVVRGRRLDWPLRYGAGAGAALGVAALTRQTAVVVMAALGLAVLLAGRRNALRFAAAGAAAIVIVAGPWWGYQAERFGNPIQSNLDRYILEDGQPREFYISAPVEDLITHPYRPAFAGELWPQFHADLWSDWFGAQHGFWGEPAEGATRVFVSSQSVLGFVASLLGLGGLLAYGGPALAGIARRRAIDSREFAFAAFLLLALLSWAAFVVQLIRFPQGGGDPIKASYMLYLTPVFAIAGLAAARTLWSRAEAWRIALLAWGFLYAASYAGYLVTAYP